MAWLKGFFFLSLFDKRVYDIIVDVRLRLLSALYIYKAVAVGSFDECQLGAVLYGV